MDEVCHVNPRVILHIDVEFIHDRHVVEIATNPLLTFTLEVKTPWEGAASWYCETVLKNEVPVEAAVNLGIGRYQSTMFCLATATNHSHSHQAVSYNLHRTIHPRHRTSLRVLEERPHSSVSIP